MVGGDPVEVTCDWGPSGLRAHARDRIVVIVDVLSFSTATTLAVGRGAIVFPCEWNDERAVALGKEHDAEVAPSMRQIPRGMRIVMPSLNGSALAAAASELGARAIVAGCLRNAAAVARWIGDQPVVVVAAGERWPDHSVRFAIEDWLGAGAILSRLSGTKSAVAEAAVVAFEHFRPRLNEVIAASPSGQELIERGYRNDVDVAAELDADDVVPVMREGAFTAPALHFDHDPA